MGKNSEEFNLCQSLMLVRGARVPCMNLNAKVIGLHSNVPSI